MSILKAYEKRHVAKKIGFDIFVRGLDLRGLLFGSLAVLIFLLLGAVGLPAFTGKAGLHVLLNGPTSGFLWGYLAAAFVGGLLLALLLPRNGSKPESGATKIVGKTKNGAGQVWQWCVIVLAAQCVFETTSMAQIQSALHLPLPITLSINFIPMIFSEWKKIKLAARARLGTKKIGFAKSAVLILYETQALLFVMLNKAESVRKAVANRA